MRHEILFGSLALALALAAAAATACSSSSSDVTDGDDGGADDGSSTLGPSNSNAPTGPAGSGLATGLPCDVQMVLENRCIACHDGSRAVPMLTYDDLAKKSAVDPTKTIAQEALVRMQSKTSPMPPPPAVPPDAEEIQIFAAWVAAGAPKGAVCTDTPPPSGKTGDGGASDAGDGGAKCTSGTMWTLGNQRSPDMHPGGACNACHQIAGGPNLRIAGTVYPTAHEPNDCNGSAPPPTLTITITDKKNQTFTMTATSSGNFETAQKGIVPPFRAKITNGTKTRAMVGSVTSGDCNSCHTQAGVNGAPGRILAP